MRLVEHELEGFRRFKELTKIKMLDKVICLIGPNEAGKTSILDSIYLCNEDELKIDSDVSDLTRNTSIREHQTIVKSIYYLDEKEKILLKSKGINEEIKWFHISINEKNERKFEAIPKIRRKKKYRNIIVNQLKKYESNPYIIDINLKLGGAINFNSLIDDINDSEENVDKFSMLDLAKIHSHLSSKSDTYPNYINKFGSIIKKFIDEEGSEHPLIGVSELLNSSVPPVLYFNEEARILKSTYSIGELRNPSEALLNLAKLSQLDLNNLADAFQNSKSNIIRNILEHANNQLTSVFKKYWSQSDTVLSFYHNTNILLLQIGDIRNKFASIAESSDGIRYYLSILSFVLNHSNNSIKPILLIDEAEQHLHYDAQVDLIKMFSKQNLASKIIYSTHSFGCLPEDFGTAIKTVKPTKINGKNLSNVENWMWNSENIDIRTMLYEMGAKTLSLIPLKFSLFVEGISDLILLPSLFRAAINKEYLNFQILPRLSEISVIQIKHINSSSSKTAFLTDSDPGGMGNVKKLKKAGIKSIQIFSLPVKDVTIEDFIDPEIFRTSFNQELEKSTNVMPRLKKSDFSDSGRMVDIERWCKTKKILFPSKRDIAINVYEKQFEKNILFTKKKKQLLNLYDNIINLFNSEDQ